MCWLALTIFLLSGTGVSYAQTVHSRDNHTGRWTDRSSWEQNWAGINNTVDISGEVHIKGYVVHGTSSASADLSFTGASAHLIVEDTLRIHGKLLMSTGAKVTIRTGGVLIVHGNYEQNNDVTFNNQGTAIFLSNWERANTGTFFNTGNMYVAGTVKAGGVINYKPYAELEKDSPAMHYFSRTNIIRAACEGNNTGTLTLEGNHNIIRWESSWDLFLHNITEIAHTEGSYTYTNLIRTTSFRVYLGGNPNYYSGGATIIVPEKAQGGSVKGPEDEFCTLSNTGTLELADFLGGVVRWESSTDGFETVSSSVTTSAETFSFTNLGTTTSFRAVVQNGNCGEAYSIPFTVKVVPETKGGFIEDAAVCKDVNSGSLTLTEHVGDVLRWESSASHDFSSFNVIDFTGTSLSYENLSQTTYYRAVVKSGSCAEAYSSIATITVSEIAGGELSGSQTVCAGDNEGLLTLENYQGNILRWESSSDNFELDIQEIDHTTIQLNYKGLTQTTYYRVVIGNAVCEEEYSTVAIITVDPAVVGGNIVASEAVVCAEENSGTLNLEGHAGEIMRWESSTDGFKNEVISIAYQEEVLSFKNLNTTTSYRAVLSSGSCGEAYSSVATITVDQPARGGVLAGGGQSLCAGGNEGILSLEDHYGEIINWELSTDGFIEDIQLVDHTAASLTFKDLTATTSYRVLLQNGSCAAVYSSIATITIDQPAVAGTIQGGGVEVCEGDNQGSLRLEGYSGEIVRWESSLDGFENDIRVISHHAAEYAYTDLVATTSYRAVVSNGSCGEVYADAITIQVIPQSSGGHLAGSITVCKDANSGSLTLTEYVGEVQRWESSLNSDFSSPVVIDFTGTALNYENLSQTTYYRAVVKSGSCAEAYSSIATITVSEIAGGELSGSQTVCAGDNEGLLTLENYQGDILRWERSQDEFQDHIEPVAHTASTLTYSGLSTTYSYRVVLGASGCSELYSTIATIVVEQAAVGGIITGGKRIIPSENRGELRVEGQQGTILRWEMSTDNFVRDIQPLEHTQSSLAYNNIEQDSWYRVLVGTGNSCEAVYSTVAALLVNRAPFAQDDHFKLYSEQVAEGFTSETSLLENDSDPDGDPLLITSGQDFTTTAGNSLSIDERGYIYYMAAPDFTGIDSLQYRVCDRAGEASRCSFAYVILEISEKPVVPDGKVVIYQGVSPNGDGLNDKWVIDHIEQYPDNQVQIFDRSGVLVWEIKGYNNTTKVFEGYRNKGFGTGGNELPESTYFYRVKLDDAWPLLRGYVIVNR